MSEHARSDDRLRCVCGGHVVFYESGESSGCEREGRPFIYARFLDHFILADGELFGGHDGEGS